MDAVRQDQQPDSDLQTASAPTDKTNVAATAVVAVAAQPPALVAEPPTLPQIAEPPVDPSSENRVARSVPTIAYRVTSPRVQTVSGPAVGAERSPERTPAGASKSNVVLLAGAAAAGLLFAGGIFHVTRHLSRRTHKQLVSARNGIIGALDITSPVASKQPSITSDPPDDVTRTLLERDLKPALEACNFPWSHHTDGSSGAISLPPAAAWLTQPKAKPTMEQQLADA